MAIPGSEFQIPCDTVIVAVGQNPDFEFLDGSVVTLSGEGGIAIDPATGSTGVPGVYAGGDAAEAGPESIIAACGDGRRAAESICWQFGIPFVQPPARDAAAHRSGDHRGQARAGPQGAAGEDRDAADRRCGRAST